MLSFPPIILNYADSISYSSYNVFFSNNILELECFILQTHTVKCSQCGTVLANRREFYRHVMKMHNQVGGAQLQARPWSEDEDPFQDVQNGEMVEECYNLNSTYILAHHDTENSVRSVYNFPVENAILNEDIEKQMRYINTNRANSYKVQVAVGCILENVEQNTATGVEETRMVYFKPAMNSFVLSSPISVTSNLTFIRAVEELKNDDLMGKVLNLKPNSKYKVRFITQVVYFVFDSGFLMGDDDAESTTPDFLLKNHAIWSFQRDTNGHSYGENLCFFTCLAQSKADTRHSGLKCEIGRFYDQWVEFVLAGHSRYTHSNIESIESFKGFEIADFPDLETCFKISICVFEMKADKSAKLIYRPIDYKEEVLYLNLHKNHLTFINNIDLYCKSYSCSGCERIFPTKWRLCNHSNVCGKKTKLNFPGGYYVFHRTLFEELEEFSIHIPEIDRFFPAFIVWDMESMLIPSENRDDGLKIKYTHTHQAVSCSISSNVEGHTHPVFVESDEVKDLVSKMFDVFTVISTQVLRNSKARWGVYIEQLAGLIKTMEAKESSKLSDEVIVVNDDARDDDNDERGSCGEEEVDGKDDNDNDDAVLKQLKILHRRFMVYITQCPIISFNGAKYDANLIRGEFSACLMKLSGSGKEDIHKSADNLNSEGTVVKNKSEAFMSFQMDAEKMGEPSIIKRGSGYQAITNNYFKFLDVASYLAPHTSYVKFLSAMGVSEGKFYFPYEWMTTYEKLSQTFIPPYDSDGWFSSIKNVHILDEEYQNWVVNRTIDTNANTQPKTGLEKFKEIQGRWDSDGWVTMKDMLQYYNNKDVIPMVKAVESLMSLFRDQGIDCFKNSISLPGIARIKLMEHAKKENIAFPIFNTKFSHIHHMIKSHLVAGASIIFHRNQEVGATKIRPDGKLCGSIEGYDCNSLYLHSISGEMPNGEFIFRDSKNHFKPEYTTKYKMMYAWLNYRSKQENVFIRSKLTMGREVRIGKYFCDGMSVPAPGSGDKTKIYEFNGCYHHAHAQGSDCPLWKGKKPEELTRMKSRYSETLKKEETLKKMGYEYETIWECEFQELKRNEPSIQKDIDNLSPKFWKNHRGSVTEEVLLKSIREDKLFGFLLVDVAVPDQLREHFEDFPPIFSNQEIYKTDIGEHMQEFISNAEIPFNKPRKLLVSGMRAKSILLSSSLIKWYLDHGIKIEKIHQVVEFCSGFPFKDFVALVTQKRKEGAKDPLKEAVAELFKLLGNSSYGSQLLDKEKYTVTKLVHGQRNAKMQVNDTRFQNLIPLGDECYEVSKLHKDIEMNLPIQIGFQILQLAKLRMLSFVYDFIMKYIHRDSFQIIQTDTDSLYLALSGSSLKDCVHKHLLPEIIEQTELRCGDLGRHENAYLPRTCCKTHNADDNKTPGLFKIEFLGTKMLCLSSKTYVGTSTNGTHKISCKGVNKMSVLRNNPIEIFESVLKDKKSRCGNNIGFRMHCGVMSTYTQTRSAFPYLYFKREVLADGVTTKTLNITQEPCPAKYYCIQESAFPLTVDYITPFSYNGIIFDTIRQAMVHSQAALSGHIHGSPLLTEILGEKRENELKKISSKLTKYTAWVACRYDVIKKILEERTINNPGLRILLLSTKHDPIINADPRDSILGVGLNYRVMRWHEGEKRYLGRNYVGDIYVSIRESLRL